MYLEALMIQGKWITNSDDFATAHSILNHVFKQELLNNNNFLREDFDSMANHLMVLDVSKGEYVGYGRIIYDLENFIIDNVCVLEEYRHKKYGDFIVRVLVDKAILCNASDIFCSVPSYLTKFLEPIGFKKYAGVNCLNNIHIYKNGTIMHLLSEDFHSQCHC